MADKTVIQNIKGMGREYAKRFMANSQAKEVMGVNSTGNRLKDIATGNRVRNLNTYINGRKPNPKKDISAIEGLIHHNKDGVLNDFIADVRKTRNNELAKTIAIDAVPVAAISAAGIGAYKIHKNKKRKDEKNMEKMSAQMYEDFVEKLAEEILEEEYDAENVEEEVEEGNIEGLDEEALAKRAYAAYEAAQMQKEASEADYDVACAYEEAALVAMEELGLLGE